MPTKNRLDNILTSSELDFCKNKCSYDNIYNFYKNKNLSVNEIELLIINTENNLFIKNTVINSSHSVFISLLLAIFTPTLSNALASHFFNNKNMPYISGVISFFVFLLILIFVFIKPVSKDNINNYSDRLIYNIELKVLNDLKKELNHEYSSTK